MSEFLTKPELIRKKKAEGVPNSYLMRQYKISYATLRKILDGVENGEETTLHSQGN